MIMKKMNKLMLGALLMAGATACTNDDLSLQDNAVANQGKAIITALTPQSGSRVAFEDDGQQAINLNWKASGETFSVAVKGENDSYSTYTYTQVSGNTFAGDAYTVTPGPYYALYPARENMRPTNIVTDYSSQTGALDERLTYMYAVADELNEDTELQFQHISAILKTTFKCGDEDVTSKLVNVLLTMPEGVASALGYDLVNQKIGSNYSDYTTILINPSQAENIYIYMPGGKLANGMNIQVSAVDDENNFYTGTISFTKTIEAGKVYQDEVELTASQAATSTTWTSETVASPMLLGMGTVDNPFLISSAEDLQWLVDNVTATSSKYFRLEKDLTIDSNANGPWTPIGTTYGNAFKGTFDGNGKTISGTLTSPADFRYPFGLFGYGGSYTCVVKNLTVAATVEARMASNVSWSYVGGIAGSWSGWDARMENCTFKGSVKGGDATGESYVGGLAGINGFVSVIKNCTNEGAVYAGKAPKSYAGGIAGHLSGSSPLTGCKNTGTVTAHAESTTSYIGGLAGYSTNSVVCTCCTNTGTTPAIGGANDAAYENQTKVDGCTNTHP